jgi:UDP-N-acetylmuramate: L-alanyl-gamma-D-glutamyl-meso-diaminopimelate ligase
MKVHFIAIGGSAMHNLAISLFKKGYQVTGSDDEIFEPSRSRLDKYGILPKYHGWNSNMITSDLDAVILGMHARSDNPELQKAKELGLKIYSYPEYLYEQTKDKTRIVIGGSHGKTTITSMIMHVLKFHNKKFDYMVGAQIDGFETMVSLTEDAPIAVFEGDEYLSSPIDPRPKFHLYKPHIALISGIAWDHINVFPTFEKYKEQFKIFIEKIEKEGSLLYYKHDENLLDIVKSTSATIEKIGYAAHAYTKHNNQTFLIDLDKEIPIKVFGEHNLQNISGAQLVCDKIGISDEDFYNAISEFKGAAKRLEVLAQNDYTTIFRDFAHSPSKLQATVKAVKDQFQQRKLIAVMELHTFSSLNANFLKEYRGAMESADIAIVYYNPEVIKHKKLEDITPAQVKDAFHKKNLVVYTDQKELKEYLTHTNLMNHNLLLMSSGNFSGIDLQEFSNNLIE